MSILKIFTDITGEIGMQPRIIRIACGSLVISGIVERVV